MWPKKHILYFENSKQLQYIMITGFAIIVFHYMPQSMQKFQQSCSLLHEWAVDAFFEAVMASNNFVGWLTKFDLQTLDTQ